MKLFKLNNKSTNVETTNNKNNLTKEEMLQLKGGSDVGSIILR